MDTFKKSKHATPKTLAPIDYIFCALLALAITAAPQYLSKSVCDFNLTYFLTALAAFAALTAAVFVIRRLLLSMRWNVRLAPTSKLNQVLNKLFNCKHPIIAIAGIILAFWAVPIILLYPGTVINDTWQQFWQFMKYMSNPFDAEGVLWDHHPIFDTFFMGAIITPIAYYTGLWHPMFFVYVILQAIFTSLAFSCVVNYAHKKLGLEILPCACILVAICVLQIYPVATQNISKDSLHSWVFVLYAICFCEMVRTHGSAIKSKKFLIAFVAVAMLCCLTKKVGCYIVLFTLIIAFFFLGGREITRSHEITGSRKLTGGRAAAKKSVGGTSKEDLTNNFAISTEKKEKWLNETRRRTLIPIACCAVLMLIAMPAFMHLTQASGGEKREMFSLPFQMSARYAKDHADEITSEEYQVIDNLLDMSTLAQRYDPIGADTVKDGSKNVGLNGYISYAKVWLAQGAKHPDTYITALNCMLSGWFSWVEYAPLMNSDHHPALATDQIPQSAATRGATKPAADAYQEAVHNLFQNPMLQIFHTFALWAAIIPAFVVCTVCRTRKSWGGLPAPNPSAQDASRSKSAASPSKSSRSKSNPSTPNLSTPPTKYWIAILPSILALMCGCWLAPVSTAGMEGFRYLFPLTYTAPLLIAWCMYVYKQNSSKNSQ